MRSTRLPTPREFDSRLEREHLCDAIREWIDDGALSKAKQRRSLHALAAASGIPYSSILRVARPLEHPHCPAIVAALIAFFSRPRITRPAAAPTRLYWPRPIERISQLSGVAQLLGRGTRQENATRRLLTRDRENNLFSWVGYRRIAGEQPFRFLRTRFNFRPLEPDHCAVMVEQEIASSDRPGVAFNYEGVAFHDRRDNLSMILVDRQLGFPNYLFFGLRDPDLQESPDEPMGVLKGHLWGSVRQYDMQWTPIVLVRADAIPHEDTTPRPLKFHALPNYGGVRDWLTEHVCMYRSQIMPYQPFDPPPPSPKKPGDPA